MGRERCIACERPVSVCLCSQLPFPPLRTRTCVIVLQHPHEARHKLSTLPILAKCLTNCHVLQGRRFQPGSSPLLDFFFTHNPPAHHALLLFPTSSAQPISTWFAHHQLQDSCSCRAFIQQVDSLCHLHGRSDLGISTSVAFDSLSHLQQAGGEGIYVVQPVDSHFQQVSTSIDSLQARAPVYTVKDTNPCSCNSGFPELVLIAVDATWQHANEMIRASAPYLNKFATPVCLPFDTSQEGVSMATSELIIRKEPFKGYMTTLEAISSCLKVLEPNGVEIHDKLTRVLRSMVHFQTLNVASHKVRMHPQKKSSNPAFLPPPQREKSECSEAS